MAIPIQLLLLPVFRAVFELLAEQPDLQIQQLLQEVGPNLKVIPLTVEILQRLIERPPVLLNEVGCDHSQGARLPPQ